MFVAHLFAISIICLTKLVKLFTCCKNFYEFAKAPIELIGHYGYIYGLLSIMYYALTFNLGLGAGSAYRGSAT